MKNSDYIYYTTSPLCRLIHNKTNHFKYKRDIDKEYYMDKKISKIVDEILYNFKTVFSPIIETNDYEDRPDTETDTVSDVENSCNSEVLDTELKNVENPCNSEVLDTELKDVENPCNPEVLDTIKYVCCPKFKNSKSDDKDWILME